MDFTFLLSEFFYVVSYLVSCVTLHHHSEGLGSEKLFKKELKLYGSWEWQGEGNICKIWLTLPKVHRKIIAKMLVFSFPLKRNHV